MVYECINDINVALQSKNKSAYRLTSTRTNFPYQQSYKQTRKTDRQTDRERQRAKERETGIQANRERQTVRDK